VSTFILLIFMYTFSNGATLSAEYDSLASCKKAGRQYIALAKTKHSHIKNNNSGFICTKK